VIRYVLLGDQGVVYSLVRLSCGRQPRGGLVPLHQVLKMDIAASPASLHACALTFKLLGMYQTFNGGAESFCVPDRHMDDDVERFD
jgi:hypothetical protein